MLCVDLYCGLGGWAEGFLSEGYRVIGFDIERHDYGRGSYPGQLVLQDARTLHGSQFKDATVIVASPPCTEPSYRAMPWKEARAIKPDVLPEWWKKCEFNPKVKVSKVPMMTPAEMDEWRQYQLDHPLPPPSGFIELFDTCFRIQREASEATGRHIPMVVENVRGAQRWVGRAKANYGSFYLWGDVGMVGRRVVGSVLRYGEGVQAFRGERKTPEGSWDLTRKNYNGDHSWDGEKANPDGTNHPRGSWFAIADSKNRGERSQKCHDLLNIRDGHSRTRHLTNQREHVKSFQSAAVAECGVKGFTPNGEPLGKNQAARLFGSKSPQRKAASAEIAKIPFPLAQHIARTFKPMALEATA